MGNFAILRVQKVKTMSSMAARGRHNFREQETPNADPDLLGQNLVEGAQSTDEMLKAILDLLPTKRRKDAVIGLEYLITASPEHFGNSNDIAYFEDAIEWLEAKHGKANVVCKTVHLDESTPHLAAFVVPLLGGKLNAKHFTGGAKALADMQTDFAEKVGKKHNLERGIERSKAVHQDNAKIKPMVIERLQLRKQVKALSEEVERLTKHVSDGGAAMAAAQGDLAKAQENWVINGNFLKIRNEKIRVELVAAQGKLEKLDKELQALKSENLGLNDLVTVTKNELETAQVDFDELNYAHAALRIKNEGLLSELEALKTNLLIHEHREPSEIEYSEFLESKKDLPRLAIEEISKTHVTFEEFGRFAVVSFRGEKSLVEYTSSDARELVMPSKAKGLRIGR